VADKSELAKAVLDQAAPGDMVLTLGAGDIWRVGEEILDRLRGDSW
jgi:UDP-N-acetylmuramate--alanine ligase